MSEKKVSRKVKVKNALGLHARPATVIAKLLQGSKSIVWFTYRNERVNARSIISILMLAATKNSTVEIEIEGDDAQELMNRLVHAFETQFGE